VDYRSGIVSRSGKGGGRDCKGPAYILGGDFETDTKVGKGIVICEYLVGSGEEVPITEKDESFLSEEEYGEYYMENRSEVRNGDPDYAVTNFKIFKLGVSIFPIPKLRTGLNYFIYNSYTRKGT
jgi:hypothetical protein